MVNRNLSEQEWMALSENRFQSTENQLKSVDGTTARVAQLAQQIEALRGQNQSMRRTASACSRPTRRRTSSCASRSTIALRPRAACPRACRDVRTRRHQAYPAARRRRGAGRDGAVPVGRLSRGEDGLFATADTGTASQGRQGQHGLYRQPELPAAQQLRDAPRSSSASMPRPASTARPIRCPSSCASRAGALGAAERQAAHHQDPGLPHQRRGTWRASSPRRSMSSCRR